MTKLLKGFFKVTDKDYNETISINVDNIKEVTIHSVIMLKENREYVTVQESYEEILNKIKEAIK